MAKELVVTADGVFSAASVAIFREGAVLLIQRARMPYRGFWTLPGGRMLPGESAEACARREVFEEVGLRVEPGFVARHVVQSEGGAFALAVFCARDAGGTVQANDEIADWRRVLPDEMGGLRTTPDLERLVGMAARLITTD